MQLERERARQKGYPSPIWDDIQQTHDNYNRQVLCLTSTVPYLHTAMVLHFAVLSRVLVNTPSCRIMEARPSSAQDLYAISHGSGVQ